MDMHIPNIRHLAAFAATVEHGSVTRAAEVVNLTQPALTQAIARFEKELDCRLFEREPSGMRPTEPALLMAPRAKVAIERIGSPRVTATQIRAFLALARSGAYSSASEKTGLSSASLHRAVKDLSLALGERLVDRRGRHIMLTRKGIERARCFGLAIAELRSGFAEVSTWLGNAGGRITVGAMPLSRARWLPDAILAFRLQHPNVDISVIEGSYAELAASLREGEIDLLLGALRPDNQVEDLEQEFIFDDQPQIIMRSDHPLAESSELSLTEFPAYPWILPSPQTPLRKYWEDIFSGSDIEPPHVSIECGSVLSIRQMLLETDSLTLLSTDQLRVEINAGLLTNKVPPKKVVRSIGIIHLRDWHPTTAQQEFLNILRKFHSKTS